MNRKSDSKNNRPSGAMIKHLMLMLILTLAGSSLHAATVTWDAGGGLDTDWSNLNNWSGDISPTGNDIVFGATGTTSSPATVTNTVNVSGTIASLLYQYNSTTAYHVTEIDSGVTLSVTGTANAFTVGGLFVAATTTTQTVITGSGALAVSQAGGQVFIGNNNSGSLANPSAVLLDMSGLAEFSADLGAAGAFNVGASAATTPNAQGSFATVHLADTNEITAGTLRVSAVATDNQVGLLQVILTPTTLYLGRENTLNVNTIQVGRGLASQANGLLRFDSSVLGSDPSVRIRGSAGGEDDAVASFVIGVNQGGGSSQAQKGEVNFSGGEVDALITDLLIARAVASNNAVGRAEGSLTMDRGTITVENTILGQTGNSTNGSTAPATIGTLNVSGGTFNTTSLVLADSTRTIAESHALTGIVNISGSATVSVTGTGGIVMGTHGAAPNVAPLTTTINLTGGSLTVSGNIAEGFGPAAITSSITLSGGTLEMNSKAISVDTFNAESGTLRNLSQLNSGGTLTKTTTGTLTVAGANTWTGATVINAGTLLVSGTHTGGGAYTINDGGTLGGAGTVATAGGAGVTLAAGGKFAPGTSPGNLTFDLGSGVLDISDGVAASGSGALIFELGTNSDRITLNNVNSTLDIGSEVLEFDDFVFLAIGGFAPGTYTLFDSGNTITGSLGGTVSGTVGGFGATIGFANGNQDLVLNVVPEPQTALLILMAGGILRMLKRRRGSI